MGICSTQTYLPRLPTPRMNRTRQIWLVVGGIRPLVFAEERLQVRLMYLILFLHTKRSRGMAKHRAKASNGLQAAPKSWFCAEVENGLQRGKPDDYRWSEGIGQWLRVWGRGWSKRKVCILAAGRDTAAKRDGRNEHHGRDVFDKKIMRWWVMHGRWWVCVSDSEGVWHFSVTLLVTLFCVKSPRIFTICLSQS
jgi:hypothetical protein